MKAVFIGDKETAIAVSVIGVEPIIVNNEDEMLKFLLKLINRNDIGLILLSENYASKIESKINLYRLKKSLPIIVKIPSRRERKIAKTDYKSILKKAIGFSI